MRTANENVIKALAKAMADARAGNVEAVAIVTVTPEGVPDGVFGGEFEMLPSINLGIDLLKAQFVFRAMKASEQPTTSIRRPVSGAN